MNKRNMLTKAINLLTASSISAERSRLLWKVLRAASAMCMLCAAASFPLRAQSLATLFTFDSANGAFPEVSLIQGRDGNFYGTTIAGGKSTCDLSNGCGTIFKITATGILTTLYSFCEQVNCADGSAPIAGLVLGTDGNLYGTTALGGAHSCTGAFSCGGTVFRITPEGVLRTLYSFCAQTNCTDGESPRALLLANNGDFYGTSGGGTYGFGTIFKITPQGKMTTLYSFCAVSLCRDGADPQGGLIRGVDGNLYGTTYAGGASGYGTIFRIAPGGKLTTMHSFTFADGANPTASLIQAKDGGFYGSTEWGGTVVNNCPLGCGTVYRISSTGKLKTLVSFDWSNGYQPYSALVQATDGNLYGTTADGVGGGTIFHMIPDGPLTTLYTFYNGSTGIFPFGGLVQATTGSFYGTTAGDGFSFGTVYSLSNGLSPFVGFVQQAAKVGATAQILGQGLTGTTSVTFNGVTATSFAVVSDTYLTAVVPTGATTGPVVVTTPSGVLTSNVNFRVTK